MILCVTGFPGAGKSTVAKLLERSGFKVYELGDMVRELIKKEGIDKNPESIRRFLKHIRVKYGKEVTARMLLKKIKTKKGDRIAIIGLRSLAELNYIKKHADVAVVAVIAPPEKRFMRVIKRKKAEDPKTMASFLCNRDRNEARLGMIGVIKKADYVIANTGTFSDLKRSVREVVKAVSG